MADIKADIKEEEEEEPDYDPQKIKIDLPGITTFKKVPQRKLDYGKKMRAILDEYSTCLVVGVDNVGSRQIAEMRKKLRGKARFLFGKNTMVRKILRDYVKETKNPKWKNLMEVCKGNTGFCFIKNEKDGDIQEMRKILLADKKNCAARAGVIAPTDVSVPAGPTGMEPTQTAFFQAMDIPTRINRGQIDISAPVQVIFKGKKVGASQASLLIKLGIKPFFYGMEVLHVYDDGEVYPAIVLDKTDDDICNEVFRGFRNIAALSFSLDYPNILTVPHTLLNAYKKTLALGLKFEKYEWDNLKLVKEMLADPDKFKAKEVVEVKEEKKEEAPKEPTPKAKTPTPPPLFGNQESSSEAEDDEESSSG